MSTLDNTLAAVGQLENEALAHFDEIALSIHQGKNVSPQSVLQALRAAGKTREDLQSAVTELADRARIAELEAERDRLNTRNCTLLDQIKASKDAHDELKEEQIKALAMDAERHKNEVRPLQSEITDNDRLRSTAYREQCALEEKYEPKERNQPTGADVIADHRKALAAMRTTEKPLWERNAAGQPTPRDETGWDEIR